MFTCFCPLLELCADPDIRRTLSKAQRRSYIKAVQCVQSSPSILPNGTAPGSKSLFDDFVYVHMQSTPFIHFTVSLATSCVSSS
jgi:tyrosinase